MSLGIDPKDAESAGRFAGGFFSSLFGRGKKPPPVVFVTTNIPKLNEYRELLAFENLMPIGIDFHDVADASIKAVASRKLEEAMTKRELRKVPFFLEVSGLHINAWNGLPGGLTRHFIEQVKCEGICRMMQGYADDERAATAITALLFHNRGKTYPMIVGKDEGKIAAEPRGDAGFHWDTIFVPKGLKKTYAELGHTEKNKRSPRKQAADQLASILRGANLL